MCFEFLSHSRFHADRGNWPMFWLWKQNTTGSKDSVKLYHMRGMGKRLRPWKHKLKPFLKYLREGNYTTCCQPSQRAMQLIVRFEILGQRRPVKGFKNWRGLPHLFPWSLPLLFRWTPQRRWGHRPKEIAFALCSRSNLEHPMTCLVLRLFVKVLHYQSL